MAWIYLIVAGILEIGWPLGLKITQFPDKRLAGFVMAVLCIAGSGFCLWLAQKTIPMGTAYAVWTGIGTVGTFVVGIYLFGDSTHPLRILSAALIVGGIIGLKLTHGVG
jgi:quaternary ammonium compound-resistance protein SugE